MSADHDTPEPARQRATIRWCPRCERGAGDAATCPACEGATVAREPDPLGVVPSGFLSSWNAASIPEALANAEQAPSTTDPADMSRCVNCGSTKVGFKPEADTDRYCDSCDERFTDPLPPISEIETRGTPLGSDPEPVCPACGSIRLTDGFSGELECLNCGELTDHAVDASAYTEPGQATLGEVTRDD